MIYIVIDMPDNLSYPADDMDKYDADWPITYNKDCKVITKQRIKYCKQWASRNIPLYKWNDYCGNEGDALAFTLEG